MKKITKAQLKKILTDHAKWLTNPSIGSRADLREADLSRASLSWANLRGANLYGADLSMADLSMANLREADLSMANLREAGLSWANLRGANLRGVDLDFGQWPLWCGSLGVKIDERLARQLVYHALAVSKKWFKPTEKQLEWVNRFHRIPEVPKLN